MINFGLNGYGTQKRYIFQYTTCACVLDCIIHIMSLIHTGSDCGLTYHSSLRVSRLVHQTPADHKPRMAGFYVDPT